MMGDSEDEAAKQHEDEKMEKAVVDEEGSC